MNSKLLPEILLFKYIFKHLLHLIFSDFKSCDLLGSTSFVNYNYLGINSVNFDEKKYFRNGSCN